MRTFLGLSTSLAFAVVATAFAAVGTQYLLPSAKVEPVIRYLENIDDIPAGGYKQVVFRDALYASQKIPAAIYRLPEPTVSGQTEFVVYSLIPKHNSCSVVYLAPGRLEPLAGRPWPGGWFEPCHHGSWDMTGKPLPWNSHHDEAPLPGIRWRYATTGNIELTGHLAASPSPQPANY